MEAPEFAVGRPRATCGGFCSGGAPLPDYLIEAYQRRGVVFKQGYGLTEVGVNCFAMTVEESVREEGLDRQAADVHRSAARRRERQRGAGRRGRRAAGCAGRTSAAATGTTPQATAAALDADGWFHTGDLARRDDEGFFYIAGRRKDMFISGGVNVYPAEIEGELLLHPTVQDAAVVGVPHETWGEVGRRVRRRAARARAVRADVLVAASRSGSPATRSRRRSSSSTRCRARRTARSSRASSSARMQRAEGTPREPRRADAPGHGRAGRRSRPAAERRPHDVRGVGPDRRRPRTGVPRRAFDFRGLLLSPGPPPPTLDGHVEDVVELLDHLRHRQGARRRHVVRRRGRGAARRGAAGSRAVARGRSPRPIACHARDVGWRAAASRSGAPRRPPGGDGGASSISCSSRPFLRSYREAQARGVRRPPAAVRGDAEGVVRGARRAPGRAGGSRPAARARADRCPTLVVGAELDATFPPEHSRAMAAAIAAPGSRSCRAAATRSSPNSQPGSWKSCGPSCRPPERSCIMKPIYIAAYHQSQFGKLLAMTVPEIIEKAVRGVCDEIDVDAGRRRRRVRSAPRATSPSTSRGCSPGLMAMVPGLGAQADRGGRERLRLGRPGRALGRPEAAARPRRGRHRGRLREDARRRRARWTAS